MVRAGVLWGSGPFWFTYRSVDGKNGRPLVKEGSLLGGTDSEKEEGKRWRRASTLKRATTCKRSRWARSTLGAPRASRSSVTAARGRLSPPPLPPAARA